MCKVVQLINEIKFVQLWNLCIKYIAGDKNPNKVNEYWTRTVSLSFPGLYV